MRSLSHIFLYALLSASAAQAGPLSRGAKERRDAAPTTLDSPSTDNERLSPAVHARQEEDNGFAPSPIFSTIEPDTPETSSSPPPASSSEVVDYESPAPSLSSTQPPEVDETSTSIIYGETPIDSAYPSEEAQPSNSPPPNDPSESQQLGTTSAETAVPSNDEPVFLPDISSTISLPEDLLPTQISDGLPEPTSAIEQPDVPPVSPIIESETPSPIPEPSESIPLPSEGGENDDGGVTPSPIFSTISDDPAPTEADSLSFSSSLSLPLDDASSVESVPISQEISSAPSDTPTTEAPESEALSTTETFPGGTLFTTEVGIPSPTEDLPPPPPPESEASSPVEESFALSSEVPAESTSTSSAPVSSTPAITPTGEPDDQIPTNRGPADPEATVSVPADIFEINLGHAKAFHQRFKSLTENSPCDEGQAACIDGKIARCNGPRGVFDLESCSEGTSCFPLPLVFEDGVSLDCVDPAEARRILGVEGEEDNTENPPPSQPGEEVTVTETPTVTETIATETIGSPEQTPAPPEETPTPPEESPAPPPPPEEDGDEVVTVTETPTVTEVTTETVRSPGEGVVSPQPTNDGGEDDVTTTTLMGTLTLTTVITVSPPAPETIIQPGTTHFVTVTVTAEPSAPPPESAAEPSPTPPSETGGSNGGDDDEENDNRDGDEGEPTSETEPEPAPTTREPTTSTSIDIIFLPPSTFSRITTSVVEEAAAALTNVADGKETVTETETETHTVAVPVTVTVVQREIRIEQETVTVTLLGA